MNKRALLVGIDRYNSPLGYNSNLEGCVNDVEDFANVLVMLGYRYDMIQIITNERASTQNILNGLTSLVNNSMPGDFIIFYFAGYGSQRIDKYNSTGSISTDTKEVLCPYDFSFEFPSFISDLELRNIFSRSLSPPVKVEIILDCGLSYGGPCNAWATEENSTQDSFTRGRHLVPPLDYSFYRDHDLFSKISRLLKAQENHKISLPNSWPVALWIGSDDNQSCCEAKINGKTRGVFTYNFCKAIRDSCIRIRRDVLWNLTNTYIKQAGFHQNVFLQTSSENELPAPFDSPIDPFSPQV